MEDSGKVPGSEKMRLVLVHEPEHPLRSVPAGDLGRVISSLLGEGRGRSCMGVLDCLTT